MLNNVADSVSKGNLNVLLWVTQVFFFFHGYSTGSLFFIHLYFVYLFIIYFGLHWAFIALCGLSLVGVSRGYSSLQCAGLLWWLLLLRSTGSRSAGFSSCGTQTQ